MDGPPPSRPGRGRVVVVFGAALGFTYLAAFLSLSVQLTDLAGPRGLLPFGQYLEVVRASRPGWIARLHDVPSLLWIGSGDSAILGLTLAGAALALLKIAGRGGRLVPLTLWLLYLSGITAGRDFFHYQWDNLLLEAGFLAIFLPGRGSLIDLVRRRPVPEPSPVVLFLLKWLLFRLLFESGMAKIVFGWDDWFEANGMTFYYETAPLPSLGGWLVQQFPEWFHTVSIYFMFLVELVMPFLIFFAHRPLRLVFFTIHLPFQASIALTSNYGFFNLLSIVLSLVVLEDRDLDAALGRARRLLRRPPPPAGIPSPSPAPARGPAVWRSRMLGYAPWCLAAFIVPASLIEASTYFFRRSTIHRRLAPARAVYSPFRSVNRYHLFPGIVRKRIVAEIEGTNDGRTWLPYRLRYAPGDPRQAPPVTGLHNPRFPFHFSFITLGRGRRDSEYLRNLVDRLCCEPRGLADLVETNPFLEKGPMALRFSYFHYRFGTWEDLAHRGVYWLREPAARPSRAVRCSCGPDRSAP